MNSTWQYLLKANIVATELIGKRMEVSIRFLEADQHREMIGNLANSRSRLQS